MRSSSVGTGLGDGKIQAHIPCEDKIIMEEENNIVDGWLSSDTFVGLEEKR